MSPKLRPAPGELRPMLATLAASLPRGEDWAYEMKWDGVRALAVVERGDVRLQSRNGNDITVAYPELHELAEQVGPIGVMLDGEIVAVDETGRASFQLLQARMHLRDRAAVEHAARAMPVAYVIFDVLWLDGSLITGVPYRQRRGLLEQLALGGPAWQTPSYGTDGDAAFATSRDLGFEGVVAKRLESVYEPGRRSSAWRKVKHQLRQEFVVGGWVGGQGAREQRIGALLLGYYDEGAELQYAGKVGTGFSDAELVRLGALLAPIEVSRSPFSDRSDRGDRSLPRDARFVKPALVAEVRFTEWTAGGRIRHPAYLGLRDDKHPDAVGRD